MKTHFCNILMFLFSTFMLAQINGIVLDNVTKEPIAYVNIWVENEDKGTTSNSSGSFVLENSTSDEYLIFSALGYETKKVKIKTISKYIELNPKATKLEEVVVFSKKETKQLIIEGFKKSTVSRFYSSGKKPRIRAKYFQYHNRYEQTPLLNKIRLCSHSETKNAKFNIRLYEVNEKGSPGNYIYDKNIYGYSKVGKRTVEIDVSDLDIAFPQSGFFIAVEWLIIEDNLYKFNYKKAGSKKKIKGIAYDPGIGTVPGETDENNWVFEEGVWMKTPRNEKNDHSKKHRNKYSLLAIELTLSN